MQSATSGIVRALVCVAAVLSDAAKPSATEPSSSAPKPPSPSPYGAECETAHAGLSWRVSPRTSRVRSLSLSASQDDRPDRLVVDVHDVGPRSDLDLYPWQPGRDGVFG